MQTTSNPKFVTGIFKKELKNRFLCEVQINGRDVVCYVPSSCHLSNFLQLEGKRVLLVPTQTPNSRTPFAVFAVPYKRNYIVLNTSMANRAVEASLTSRRFCFLGKRLDAIKEHTVCGYKTDLFLPSSNTIVEIKSVISTSEIATFPTVFSERSLKQLKKLGDLLDQGYQCLFAIVSLNPYVKEIRIDTASLLYEELKKCVDKGLVLKSYTCKLCDNKLQIDKQIPLLI